MFDPDIFIIAGIKKIGALISKTIIEPLSLTIGGIPITAISLLLLLGFAIAMLYENDKKNNGVVSSKLTNKINTSPRFLRWMLVGVFGLIGLILMW